MKRLPIIAAVMLGIAWLDGACGPELSPWIAYIVPIAMASRYCSFSTGAFYCVVAGLLLCLAAKHSGHPYSTTGYFLFATLSQTLVFLTIAWFVSRLVYLEGALRAALTNLTSFLRS